MAGWTVLEALAGLRHDAGTGAIELRHPGDGSLPFLTDTGFGLALTVDDEIELRCTGGHIEIASLTVWADEPVRHTYDPPITIESGQTLRVQRESSDSPLVAQGAHD